MVKPTRTFVIIMGIIAALVILIYASGISKYWSLMQLKEHADQLAHVAEQHTIMAPLGYILFYILFTALSIPEAVILTIAGGFLFGAVRATIYITFAATTGGTISFLTIRYLVGKKIQRNYADQFARFKRAFKTYGALYLLIVRFIVIIPFVLVNILAALTPIPVTAFIVTTAIGIIPGTFVYALAGQHLHTINSIKDIFTLQTIMLLVLLVLLAGISLVIQRIVVNKKSRG